jgi:chemotaxis protein CheD
MSSLPEVTYHLEPGYIYASSRGDVIRTVVGSCVAVCLWDAKHRMGGMSHFLYPSIDDRAKATAKYGNVAVPALVRMVLDCGGEKPHLTAQIYGGAKLTVSDNEGVGVENIEMAKKVLSEKAIPVISEDVGGNMGRKILFDTISGQVAVLKVHRLRTGDWIKKLKE